MSTDNYGYGRKIIYTDYDEITDDNICEVVKETFEQHLINSKAQESLFDYEKGKQPILDRVKNIRPEINHKLVDNEASKIVDINEPFNINGFQMDFPMDDSYDAPLTEILGCRCSVKYIK